MDVSLPHTKAALPAYYIVAPAEASSNLARYDGVRYGLRVNGKRHHGMYEETRAEGFGGEVKRRILIGTYVLSAGYYDAYYLKAQKVRTLIKRDFDEAFEKVDVILTPGDADARLCAGQPRRRRPHRDVSERIFTVTVNMAGLPGLVVPAGVLARACRSGCKSSASLSMKALVLRARARPSRMRSAACPCRSRGGRRRSRQAPKSRRRK